MNCKILDENGKELTVIMGCYGIGVTRCMAAIIEQNCDESGIVWPMSVAPYQAIVIPVNAKDETQVALAEKIYADLCAAGIDTLLDDRNERPGVKFKDADLIGIPLRINVGKKAADGIVEYKVRKSGEMTEITVDEAIANVISEVNKAK